jgi:hypothetical protein
MPDWALAKRGKNFTKGAHGMATFQPPDVPKEPEPV